MSFKNLIFTLKTMKSRVDQLLNTNNPAFNPMIRDWIGHSLRDFNAFQVHLDNANLIRR